MKKNLLMFLAVIAFTSYAYNSANHPVYHEIDSRAKYREQTRDHEIYEGSEVLPLVFAWGKLNDGSLECILMSQACSEYIGIAVEPDFWGIEVGRKLLFKLDNGEIIDLSNYKKSGKYDRKQVRRWCDKSKGFNEWHTIYGYTGRYHIEKSELDRMANHKITKMRIEDNEKCTEYVLTPEKQDQLQAEIRSWLNRMNNTLNGDKIYNDF